MSVSQKNVNPSLAKETESRINDSRLKKKKKSFRRVKSISLEKCIKMIQKIVRAGAQKWKGAIKFGTSN